ncbi:MAG TPA: hypothetical protein VKI44_19955 [Acetobacteraceae bacterium]|nr:hypothetical protein [Acetobacteraceae bacterium]
MDTPHAPANGGLAGILSTVEIDQTMAFAETEKAPATRATYASD